VIRAKPEVEVLTPYAAPLEGRRALLRLDFNESTVGPSPRVLDAIRGLPPEAYATYPEYAGLTEAFAASLGVGPTTSARSTASTRRSAPSSTPSVARARHS
jgi:histidinol-phosphate aminotransferase